MNPVRCAAIFVGLAVSLQLAGCGEFFANQTASLGGGTAGSRGIIRVAIINNTPQRAVFTLGTFDPTDQFSQPALTQFSPDPPNQVLDGDSSSPILALQCGRVFAIGTPLLLSLIDQNVGSDALVADALVPGVEFFRVADPGTGAALNLVGVAPAFEAKLGTDFPCGALLVIRFEINDVGPDPFRIDFEMIPSESTR